MMSRTLRLWVLGVAVCSSSVSLLLAQPLYSTNIHDLYAALSFDPAAANCGILVQINDTHMSLNPTVLVRTNMDDRLVGMINALQPPPTALVQAGDLGGAGSACFGAPAEMPYASNELVVARQQYARLTNCSRIYAVPGNHDTPPAEAEDAALFNSVFPELSRYTNFTVAGLPVIALDGHNGGWLDQDERRFLGQQRKALDQSREVLLVIHQPILPPSTVDARESGRAILDFARGWTAPVWVGAGHAHYRTRTRWSLGGTQITQMVTPAGNNHTSLSTNPYHGSAAGFSIWCITNGSVRGIISAVLCNTNYYLFGDEVIGEIERPYDSVSNLVFRADEGHFDRDRYGVTLAGPGCYDAVYWRSYVGSYTCRLPISRYPAATHVLLGANTGPDTQYALGRDTNSLMEIPREYYRAGVVGIPIPLELRGGPDLWLRAQSAGEFHVGSFGLASTNELAGFPLWAGRTLWDAAVMKDDPSGIPGVTAWTAYLFGLDPRREPGSVVPGQPWLGGWPRRTDGWVRVACRDGLVYRLDLATGSPGGWRSFTSPTDPATNGWREWLIDVEPTTTGRISATPQEGPAKSKPNGN